MKKRLSLSIFLVLILLMAVSVSAEEVKWDLGGQTIRIQTRWEDVTPLGERGAHNWYEPDERLLAHIKSVEEMFNCKIEFVARGHEGDAWAAIQEGSLLGETTVHFAHFSAGMVVPATAGALHPLNDILDDEFYESYPIMFQYPRLSGDSVGSTIYGFEALGHSREARVIMWNKSLFEREGIESLYDIYERGEWTWDKFYEIARALTKDTDGDGEYDQYGLGALGVKEVYDFLVSNGARFTQIREDGRVEFDLLRPEFLETMEFLQKIWSEGLVGDGISSNRSRAAMWLDIGTHISNPGRQAEFYAIQNDEWGIVPPPQGPNGKGEVNMHTRWVGVIPNTVEDPRAVIEVVSALFQTREPYIDKEEWEAKWWDRHLWALYDYESFEYLQEAMRNSVLVPDHVETRVLVVHAEPKAEAVFDQIIKQGASAASVLAEWEPVLQGYLDEMLKQ